MYTVVSYGPPLKGIQLDGRSVRYSVKIQGLLNLRETFFAQEVVSYILARIPGLSAQLLKCGMGDRITGPRRSNYRWALVIQAIRIVKTRRAAFKKACALNEF